MRELLLCGFIWRTAVTFLKRNSFIYPPTLFFLNNYIVGVGGIDKIIVSIRRVFLKKNVFGGGGRWKQRTDHSLAGGGREKKNLPKKALLRQGLHLPDQHSTSPRKQRAGLANVSRSLSSLPVHCSFPNVGLAVLFF